jgi:hypothetical protein
MDPRLHPQVNPAQPTGPAQAPPPSAPQPPQPQPATPVHAQPASPQTPPPTAMAAPRAQPTVAQPAQAHQAAPMPQVTQIPVQEGLKAEIVEAIPVRQPGQNQGAPAPSAPVIQMPNSPPPAPAEPHDDLDKILQAVNNRVATPMQPQSKPKTDIVKKIAGKAAKVKPANKSSKPVGLTAAVIIVAVTLSVLAVRAYHQAGSAAPLSSQPGKVGTSYAASGAIQSAGGTLVRPADLDDYSQELQKQLNSLNDSQDFAVQPLSDQVLGL